MGDNDSTGRRPKFAEGDVERASKMRRHPRPAGAPIVSPVVEDDVTPLPQEPPDISQIEGFSGLPPVAQRVFQSLHNVQREHDVAFARLWDARHVHQDVAELQQSLAELQPYLTYLRDVHGVLDQHGKQLYRVVTWVEGRKDADKKLELTLDSLNGRLGTMEGDFRTMNATIATFGRDIAEGFRRRDAELEEFKAEVDERFEKLEVEQKTTNAKYEERIRSLEDSRLSARAQAAVIAALVALLGFLIEHFWK